MKSFSNIKELLSALYREEKLLSEMFKKRKSVPYRYDYAYEITEENPDRLQFLFERAVLRENGNYLEIDDLYLQFFEQVLETNEEINTSYINENLEKVTQNIIYYFNETNEARKYDYLRIIKNTLRKIGLITLRNVIDLKRNIENTFKNEPNYKNKMQKLIHLDTKRNDISRLIEQTEQLMKEDEKTFFRTATDEELLGILHQMALQLAKCRHNLIEIEKQIIDYLNQISMQSSVIEKLRKLKYLKDQVTIEAHTDILSVLATHDLIAFEPRPRYPLKLSLETLQSSDEAFELLKKVAKQMKSGINLKRKVADDISDEYLTMHTEEEIQINLEEIKNGFMASGYSLFDFICSYNFAKEMSFEDRIMVYCQLISMYEQVLDIKDAYQQSNDMDVAIVYPK